MNCKICNTPLKPLFTGTFCPNEACGDFYVYARFMIENTDPPDAIYETVRAYLDKNIPFFWVPLKYIDHYFLINSDLQQIGPTVYLHKND